MTPAHIIVAADARRRFASEVAQGEERINLARAALLVAAEEESGVDVEANLALLDELGAQARARVAERWYSPVLALNDFLFAELGFKGDEDHYYDLRNSLLNQVLARRMGLPITLSIVYMEVGRRAGLHVEGVGRPGHFMVRAGKAPDELLLVDPFYCHIENEERLEQQISDIYGEDAPPGERYLETTGTRAIIFRLLTNLKNIYMKARLFRRSLAVVERLLLLNPRAVEERRDRGLLLLQLERLHEALADLESYVRVAPDNPVKDEVRDQLDKIQKRIAALN